ncbi:efflux RND transporter periplasmic adaptor subunit [Methylibium sp.]|uniref:efflux RND transporter periplasmic adaptor subunit n=1 Tax=Methylibium sp. TaxID=2067992 RepID=UPI003D1486B0
MFLQRVWMRPMALVAVLSAAAALAACGRGGAANAPASPPLPEVGVLTIAPRNVALQSELPGRVSASLVAEVRPQVGGIVLSRDFREGSDVRKGQTLYQIDPAPYRAALGSAQAALAKAQANGAAAQAKSDRYKELVQIDAVSKQAADEATAAALQADADVASAQAALETARINLAYTRITAPISGRIGKSSVTPGALLTANQATALSTVQQLDTIYVDVTQSSSELLRLRREIAAGRLKTDTANQAVVKLRLDDGTLYPQTGKLQFSDVTVDEQTNSVTLRATFPNPKQLLLPGLYVRAVLEEGVREGAILVPQKAVARDNRGNAIAMVVGSDGRIEQRAVNVPRTVGGDWLVDGGLKPGEQVVVEGLQRARPGAQVKAADMAASAAAAPAGAASVPAAASGAAASSAGKS